MTPQTATDVTDNRASSLKVAAIQARSTPGDVEANIHRATPLVEQAAAQGARVVVSEPPSRRQEANDAFRQRSQSR
jgi:hypothetical protein